RSRPRGAGLADAFLVEFAVIRQVELEALAEDLAAIGDDDRIVHAAGPLEGRADDDARPAIRRVFRELDHGPLAGGKEGTPEHEVFRRITCDEELREQHEVGALAGGVRPRLARLGEIAGDIADDRVELRDGDAQRVWSGLLGHGERCSAALNRPQCRWKPLCLDHPRRYSPIYASR